VAAFLTGTQAASLHERRLDAKKFDCMDSERLRFLHNVAGKLSKRSLTAHSKLCFAPIGNKFACSRI